jgi:hypothetical protein
MSGGWLQSLIILAHAWKGQIMRLRDRIFDTVMINFGMAGSFVIAFKAVGTVITWRTGEAMMFFR